MTAPCLSCCSATKSWTHVTHCSKVLGKPSGGNIKETIVYEQHPWDPGIQLLLTELYLQFSVSRCLGRHQTPVFLQQFNCHIKSKSKRWLWKGPTGLASCSSSSVSGSFPWDAANLICFFSPLRPPPPSPSKGCKAAIPSIQNQSFWQGREDTVDDVSV